MANSIQYQIALDMITSLKLIKTAGGYEYNVPDANIILAKTTTKLPGYPALMLHSLESTPVNEYDQVQDEWYRWMICFYNNHSAEDESIDLYVDNRNIVADIMKSLRVDETRSGLAVETEKMESGYDIDDDVEWPYSYVVVRTHVLVNANDPYTLAG